MNDYIKMLKLHIMCVKGDFGVTDEMDNKNGLWINFKSD